MNIAVVGGRTRRDKEFVFAALDDFIKTGDTVVSGAAVGVDSFAKEYAEKHQQKYLEFPPDQTIYPGRNPYLARNEEIVKAADVILAFPSKESSGTWYTVNYARREGKRVIVFGVG